MYTSFWAEFPLSGGKASFYLQVHRKDLAPAAGRQTRVSERPSCVGHQVTLIQNNHYALEALLVGGGARPALGPLRAPQFLPLLCEASGSPRDQREMSFLCLVFPRCAQHFRPQGFSKVSLLLTSSPGFLSNGLFFVN